MIDGYLSMGILQASFTLKQYTYNVWDIHIDFLKRPKNLSLNCIVKPRLQIEHFL